jgi:hypothetical protein
MLPAKYRGGLKMAWVRVVRVTRDEGKGGTKDEMMKQAKAAGKVLKDLSGWQCNIFYGDGSGVGWSISVWDSEKHAKDVDSHADVVKMHNNDLKPKIKEPNVNVSYYEAF